MSNSHKGAAVSLRAGLLLVVVAGVPRVRISLTHYQSLPQRRDFKRFREAKTLVAATSKKLIDDWRADHRLPSANSLAHCGAPAGEADALNLPGGDAAPVKRAAGEGVAPGSFLGLLLDARDRGTGESLSDMSIMSQTNTFTLAGVETTSTALSFAIHGVASHPEVERRLLAEVDAYGRDREVRCLMRISALTGSMGLLPHCAASVNRCTSCGTLG